MPFGMEKLEWFGYPTVTDVDDIFIRIDRVHERDRQTDRRTNGRIPHDGIGRACIASRGKAHHLQGNAIPVGLAIS